MFHSCGCGKTNIDTNMQTHTLFRKQFQETGRVLGLIISVAFLIPTPITFFALTCDPKPQTTCALLI